MNRSKLLAAAALTVMCAGTALAQSSTPMSSGSGIGSSSSGSSSGSTSNTGMNGSGLSTSSSTTMGGPGTQSTVGTSAGPMTTAKLSTQDKRFINTAAMSGLAEVAAGQLAESKGDAAVQAVGKQMVTDHQMANQQLMQIAQSKGVTPPSSPSATDQKEATRLNAMSGSAFDKAYLSNQLKAHTTAIAVFKTEATKGSDLQFKAFASQTLPTLQEHLAMIKKAMKS